MTFLAAITELLILARERGDEAHATAAATVEGKLDAMQAAAHKRNRQRCTRDCARCGRGTKRMLCYYCESIAPEAVRCAFDRAQGLDGMREATAIVMNWARDGKGQMAKGRRRAA